MHRGMNRSIADNLTTLINRLSGKDAENWESALESLLEQEDPWKARVQMLTPIKLRRARTVTIGGRSHEDYVEAIKQAERSIEPNYALRMLYNVPLKAEIEQVTVVYCDGDMFHRWPNYQNVVSRMAAYGLTYCHPEVALALASEPKLCGGSNIVTEGVSIGKGQSGYFKLARVDGQRWLDSAPIDKAHETAYVGSRFYLCLPAE